MEVGEMCDAKAVEPRGQPLDLYVEHAGAQPAGFEPSVDEAREGQTHDDGRQNKHPGRLGRRTCPPRAWKRGAVAQATAGESALASTGTRAPADDTRTVNGFHRPDDFEAETLEERGRSTCYRVAEVAQLERKRLRSIDARGDDVSGPVRQPELAECLRVPEGTPESKTRTGSFDVSS